MGNIEIIGLTGLPEFDTSHNLSETIFEAALSSAGGIQNGDGRRKLNRYRIKSVYPRSKYIL